MLSVHVQASADSTDDEASSRRTGISTQPSESAGQEIDGAAADAPAGRLHSSEVGLSVRSGIERRVVPAVEFAVSELVSRAHCVPKSFPLFFRAQSVPPLTLNQCHLYQTEKESEKFYTACRICNVDSQLLSRVLN